MKTTRMDKETRKLIRLQGRRNKNTNYNEEATTQHNGINKKHENKLTTLKKHKYRLQ